MDAQREVETMSRHDPSFVIVDDELELQELHDRAEEWASMTPDERKEAFAADPEGAREAQEAARSEGLLD
jgi:hypothetical protein